MSEIYDAMILARGHGRVGLNELEQLSGLHASWILELVEAGVLEPFESAGEPEEWAFEAHSVRLLRSAERLRESFDLNVGGLVVALTMMERVEELEREIEQLRCSIPRELSQLR